MSLAEPESDALAGHPSLRLLARQGDFEFVHPPLAGPSIADTASAGSAHAGGLPWKSVLDVVVATALLLAALPVILLLALAIWSVDRNTAFYAQPRIGRNGRVFRVWKLRSMYIDADKRLARHLREDAAAAAEWQRCFKLRQDPRILPLIGNFIRRTSLDELPQFWNIIRGEMSLVGPRPFPAYHLECFSEEFQRLRSSVLPGLTGLWQIQSRSDGDLSDQEHWDAYYIYHQSFRLDLSILARTIPAVLAARGAR